MAEYAVGDIQGCMEALSCVLEKVAFNPSSDRLWLVGDLVNRGPQSLDVLRYVKSLGESAVVVLGNHDLHLLAVAAGAFKLKRKDTLQAILDAPDKEDLLTWLRQCPLTYYDKNRDLFMAHAGLPPGWSVPFAKARAKEVQEALTGKRYKEFLTKMYGNEPTRWKRELSKSQRLRVITNYFTRMRFIDKKGNMDLVNKSEASSAPKGFAPWFTYAREDKTRVLFGHWAALMGKTGSDQFIGLDTGCIWGGELTLMNIDTGEKFSSTCDTGAQLTIEAGD